MSDFRVGPIKFIRESTELEAFYPPCSLADELYAAKIGSTRGRAFARLCAVMVDGTTYTVTKREELRSNPNPDVFGDFVVTINYVANMDTLMEQTQ